MNGAPNLRKSDVVAAVALAFAVPGAFAGTASAGTVSSKPASGISDTPGVILLRGSDLDATDSMRLVPPRLGGAWRTPLGSGWRHDFDIVLARSGPDLIVHDERGRRRRFTLDAAEPGASRRTYVGRKPADGDIVTGDGTHVWHREDESEVTFRGSRPITIESASGESATLRYASGRLVAVQRSDGRTTRFEHAGGRLVAVTLADGTRFETTVTSNGALAARRHGPTDECRPGDRVEPEVGGHLDDAGETDRDGVSSGRGDGEDSPDPEWRDEGSCDTARHPPEPDFASAPGIAGAIRVDARPASCRSYFVEHFGTERGAAIERGLDGLPHYAAYTSTVGNFPIVDFIGPELRVVRSRDLASPSYDAEAEGLYERLMRDGKEIARDLIEPLAREGSLGATELGRTTTLAHRPERRIVLELVVRHGLASADQEAQIARATAGLLARHAIVLRVIEIP